jgi:hypothetical protein
MQLMVFNTRSSAEDLRRPHAFDGASDFQLSGATGCWHNAVFQEFAIDDKSAFDT